MAGDRELDRGDEVLTGAVVRHAIEYLINNAGFGQGAPFAETSEALYDQFQRVILEGPYFLTQRLLQLFARGGAIVNVTSNSSRRPEVGYSAYATISPGDSAAHRAHGARPAR